MAVVLGFSTSLSKTVRASAFTFAVFHTSIDDFHELIWRCHVLPFCSIFLDFAVFLSSCPGNFSIPCILSRHFPCPLVMVSLVFRVLGTSILCPTLVCRSLHSSQHLQQVPVSPGEPRLKKQSSLQFRATRIQIQTSNLGCLTCACHNHLTLHRSVSFGQTCLAQQVSAPWH